MNVIEYLVLVNDVVAKQNKETYIIYGVQRHHYKAEVKANSKEEALTLAENNHGDYEWKDTDYIDDWRYENE